jgi:hypothetical protein
VCVHVHVQCDVATLEEELFVLQAKTSGLMLVLAPLLSAHVTHYYKHQMLVLAPLLVLALVPLHYFSLLSLYFCSFIHYLQIP